jgi:hypothetical protein
MSHARKNTFIARKSKSNNDYSHNPVLRTEANANVIISRDKDSEFIYQTVTLTDEQLKLIRDEKLQQIKGIMFLDNFNPFSPKVIEYKKEMEQFVTQKEIFAQGLFLEDSKKPNGQKNISPLKSALAQHTLFHSAVIKQELFSFLEPTNPFKPKTGPTTLEASPNNYR